jgi:multiple sugar transport system ATP-binding protein
LSSLDAKLREDLRIELKRIQVDLGATVLYVTHDQVEALTLADRIGVLAAGRLIQVGAPREIYARPDNIYVAQRLGSPPINLLPAGFLGIDAPAQTAQIGIRPEDLSIDSDSGGNRAEVIQVEHLGAETVAVLQVGDRRLHVLSEPGSRLRAGQRTSVRARNEAVLFFDRNGRRLENPQ